MGSSTENFEIDDIAELTADATNQTRKVVASYASNVDECRMFLSMLGIGPEKLESDTP